MNSVKFDNWQPPVPFYFKVTFGDSEADFATFKEVSGIEVACKHPSMHQSIVCRYGIEDIDGNLLKWIREVDNISSKIILKTVHVYLMGTSRGSVIAHWVLTDVYPIKYDISSSDVNKGKLTIESVEFECRKVERCS